MQVLRQGFYQILSKGNYMQEEVLGMDSRFKQIILVIALFTFEIYPFIINQILINSIMFINRPR